MIPYNVIDRLDTRKIGKTKECTLPKGFVKEHLELLKRLKKHIKPLKKDYKDKNKDK